MYLLFHWEQFKWASEPRNSKKIKIKLEVRLSVKIYGVKDLHDIFFRIYFMWIDISYKIDILQRPTSSSVSDRKMFRFYKKFINSLSKPPRILKQIISQRIKMMDPNFKTGETCIWLSIYWFQLLTNYYGHVRIKNHWNNWSNTKDIWVMMVSEFSIWPLIDQNFHQKNDLAS